MQSAATGAHVVGVDLADRTAEAFAPDGPLIAGIEGFAVRDGQQQLARAVAQTIDAGESLIAEAGTGTGKTFAYLVPALLSGQRAIISTGTRALQDQLYHRDLPRVRGALGVGLKTALLKGRSNYLCRYRTDRARSESRFAGHLHAGTLHRLSAWSGQTRSGDLAEFEGLPEDSPLWPAITSTVENCLGSECPFWDDCFVVQARARAQAADLVVVNHHLLLADLALKQEGFGEILPGAAVFILDEAHQLPELAAQFFGDGLSARQLTDLCRDALTECAEVPGALATLQPPVAALEQGIREVRLELDPLPARGSRKLALARAVPVLGSLDEALSALGEALAGVAETSPGLALCCDRATDLRRRLSAWRIPTDAAPDDNAIGIDTDIDTAANRAPAPDVFWYELGARGFVLHRTPLDVSGPLRQFRERSRAAWVFTSATLSVADRFDHFIERLGLDAPRTLLQPSPFDWPEQALCYLPPALPEPNAANYTRAMIAAVRPVLRASGGRAFLLFTSHRALREAAEELADDEWPLFVQGRAPQHLLLEQFRASGNGVLLGAASFWEGVDVAGDALTVVVIDRLPFAAPGDPVLEARLDAVTRAGGNAFRDEQIPTAVLALKQGVGRLIRSDTDCGVLVLCDPRLLGKPYGRMFLSSIPPMPRTRDIRSVCDFLHQPRTALHAR